nr:hypothetical protein P5645_09250 [Bacillus subtilis]WGD74969.1 hypothetical protein P5631_13505 [Bacillus subtilis]
MANLVSVKTLDMVNGEITKVEYGGAEYVKTDSPVQEGDIFLLTEGHLVIGGDTGAFYMANKRPGGGIEIPTMYRGNASAVQKNGNGIAFRKVAASTNPSVEDRVAKAEGEIESLKSDVGALKGEAGYKRIAKSEARAGDYVKFIETDDEGITIGKMYEIEAIDCGGDPVFTDDIDQENYATSDDTYEVYRKPDAASVEAEPKPERLKVGDYAKVVGGAGEHQAEINDIVQVMFSFGNLPFRCDDISGKSVGWFYEGELVRATDEEVAEAKDAAEFAKFKEGDKVRLKSGGGKFPLNGYENGKVYEVGYVCFPRDSIHIIGGNACRGFATPDQLEILSEEEAAEYKKWAEIGREVGEFKKGDIVRYDYGDNEICEVVDDTEDGRVGVQTKDYGICREKPDTLRLITPVEARFDR